MAVLLSILIGGGIAFYGAFFTSDWTAWFLVILGCIIAAPGLATILLAAMHES